VRKWFWLPLLLALVAGGAAAALSFRQTPIYQASAAVRVRPPQSGSPSGYYTTLTQTAKTYSQLMTKRALLQQVIDDLALPISVEALMASITVVPEPDTELLNVRVQGANARRIADTANALVKDFIAQVEAQEQQQIDSSLRSVQTRIGDLEARIASDAREIAALRSRPGLNAEQQAELNRIQQRQAADAAIYAILIRNYEDLRSNQLARYETLSLVDPAAVPGHPIRPNKLLNTLLAAALAALLGVGLAFLVEHLDSTFKSEEDVRSALNVPVLGTLAFRRTGKAPDADLITLAAPRAPDSEAYRRLRTNLLFSTVERSLKAVVVTSAVPREGKTRTAANLAITLAESGLRVILVDADFRRPAVHHLFRRIDERGLSNMILDDRVYPEFVHQTALPNLKVICGGTPPPNPSELLGSKRLLRIVHDLATEADILVFDTPPINAVTDAALLAARFDATILVIEAGRTSRAAVQRAKDTIQAVGGSLAGAVLNKVKLPQETYYYDYESVGAKSRRSGGRPRFGATPRPEPAAVGDGHETP
jgi:capsular exopolysaccharide synthesis family protein